ncbi:unnamed protein product [Cylindrotheca closterium]|uniref:Uncharacterized protein n=1 Tax=Cylindrotheca closterium TaxID=2856 RepID=A0AAD2CLT4_9STRA|nr:unnamed protein product [Cylindrotheca closterium]CAJ1938918.1 unnamed protein product [Cylindrotheca closterium]
MPNTHNMIRAQGNTKASATYTKRTDEMKKINDLKRKLFLSKLPAKTAEENQMSNILSHSHKKSRSESIDKALDIVNSPSRRVSGRRGPLRRKGSSLSERRTIELLTDNSDHLSELLRKNQDCLFDFSSDDESDLED